LRRLTQPWREQRRREARGVKRASGSIAGTTRVVGILGDPVEHSLSPRMHNAAFRELGLDFVYVPFRPPADSIVQAVRAVRSLGLAGVNVTVPFKESVLRGVDRVTDTARAVRAANTIYQDAAGDLVADNTDVAGFLSALASRRVRLRGAKALVIGAGGAARAVVYALIEGGAAEVVVANRTIARARSVARALRPYGGSIRAMGLDVLADPDALARFHLVVNSTSVGLGGGRFFDYQPRRTARDCVHFDLAYGDEPTAFLRTAARAGRPTIDGRSMLLYQGVAAFRLFTGRKAPVDVMARSIGIEP